MSGESYRLEDLDVGQLLGRGGFAQVHRAWHRPSGREVAVKIVRKQCAPAGSNNDADLVDGSQSLQQLQLQHEERLRNEVSIHRQLRHPNIVQCFDVLEDDDHVYFVLELCPGENLFRYWKRKGCLSESETVFIITQVLYALQYLHSLGIIHRDLKLSNILLIPQSSTSVISAGKTVDSPSTPPRSMIIPPPPLAVCVGEYTVKLCDFGLATQLAHPDEEHYTLCGTPNYIAPEIVSQQSHSFSADVWSLGCLFYTLAVGSPPFEIKNDVQSTLRRIVEGDWDAQPAHALSALARDFLKLLLSTDPASRPDVSAILAHPLVVQHLTSLTRQRALMSTSQKGMAEESSQVTTTVLAFATAPAVSTGAQRTSVAPSSTIPQNNVKSSNSGMISVQSLLVSDEEVEEVDEADDEVGIPHVRRLSASRHRHRYDHQRHRHHHLHLHQQQDHEVQALDHHQTGSSLRPKQSEEVIASSATRRGQIASMAVSVSSSCSTPSVTSAVSSCSPHSLRSSIILSRVSTSSSLSPSSPHRARHSQRYSAVSTSQEVVEQSRRNNQRHETRYKPGDWLNSIATLRQSINSNNKPIASASQWNASARQSTPSTDASLQVVFECLSLGTSFVLLTRRQELLLCSLDGSLIFIAPLPEALSTQSSHHMHTHSSTSKESHQRFLRLIFTTQSVRRSSCTVDVLSKSIVEGIHHDLVCHLTNTVDTTADNDNLTGTGTSTSADAQSETLDKEQRDRTVRHLMGKEHLFRAGVRIPTILSVPPQPLTDWPPVGIDNALESSVLSQYPFWFYLQRASCSQKAQSPLPASRELSAMTKKQRLIASSLTRMSALITSVRVHIPLIVYYGPSTSVKSQTSARQMDQSTKEANESVELNAKAMLMSNRPLPDFHVQWSNGTTLHYSLRTAQLSVYSPRQRVDTGGSSTAHVTTATVSEEGTEADTGDLHWRGHMPSITSDDQHDWLCIPQALHVYLLDAQALLQRCLQEDHRIQRQQQRQHDCPSASMNCTTASSPALLPHVIVDCHSNFANE